MGYKPFLEHTVRAIMLFRTGRSRMSLTDRKSHRAVRKVRRAGAIPRGGAIPYRTTQTQSGKRLTG